MSSLKILATFPSIFQTKHRPVSAASFCPYHSLSSGWKIFPKKTDGPKTKAARLLICILDEK
jgi:hypothetical protein